MPLSAKILAIADVYDALTAYDRPYKKAMTMDQALSILKADKGKQFETGFFFPIDNFVSLKIIIKSINLSMISRVVLIQHKPVGTGYIMGVEFIDVKMVERKRLLTYIHSLTPMEKQTLIRFY